MSLLYRNSNGVETPVSGLNGSSGELVPSASYFQTGSISLAAQAADTETLYSVIFDTPMPDADYVVYFSRSTSTRVILVVNVKTTTGFRFYARNITSAGESAYSVQWQAFKLMTDENRALDEAAIEQNATDIDTIEAKIPSSASASNLLATANDISAINSRIANTNSSQIWKITRTAVRGGGVIFSDVFGSQWYVSIGDQSDRFDCTQITTGYISNTPTFYVDGSSAYLEIASYILYVVAVLGSAAITAVSETSGSVEAIKKVVTSSDIDGMPVRIGRLATGSQAVAKSQNVTIVDGHFYDIRAAWYTSYQHNVLILHASIVRNMPVSSVGEELFTVTSSGKVATITSAAKSYLEVMIYDTYGTWS